MTSKLLPFLALVASVGMFFGYINPTWTGVIAETKVAIASDDDALAAANAYTEKASALEKAKSDIDQANLKRLEVFLPNSVNNVRLILDLNALAARNGFSVSNIDVAKAGDTAGTAGTGGVGSANLSLSAVGTYAQLQSFLKGIELSERLLDVRDISLAGSDTGVYSYKMTMRLYWLR